MKFVNKYCLGESSIFDEVFMSGTAAEITPVRSVDGISVGIGRCGPATKAIQKVLVCFYG